jgi:hypothetical protein
MPALRAGRAGGQRRHSAAYIRIGYGACGFDAPKSDPRSAASRRAPSKNSAVFFRRRTRPGAYNRCIRAQRNQNRGECRKSGGKENKFLNLRRLTSGGFDLALMVEVRYEVIDLIVEGGRRAVLVRRGPQPEIRIDELFQEADAAAPIRPAASSSSTKANRPQGRDAKPRAGENAGGRAAERVMTLIRRGTRRGRLVVTSRAPNGENAGRRRLSFRRRFTGGNPLLRCISGLP